MECQAFGLPAEASSAAWLALTRSEDAAAVIYDPACSSRSIVGATAGFQQLTGFKASALRSQTREDLVKGVPEPMISRSARKNFGSFCQTSLLPGVQDMAESSGVHAFARQDGSLFSSFETLGLCFVDQRPYVLAVHIWLSEGPLVPRLPRGRAEELAEQAHHTFGCLRQLVRRSEVPMTVPADLLLKGNSELMMARGMTFFSKRLQERCILLEGGRSAARREPEELPVGCMLFGNSPMIPTEEGLRFALRVDGVTSAFDGLPLLGFTRRRPADEPGLHPAVARCLGRSVFVGGTGEAFARDQEHNFVVGFKKIPETEVAAWSTDQKVPCHSRTAPVRLQVGDVIECRCTWEGCIQFWWNGAMVLDFDLGRPLEAGGVYWPVVDVCHSVTAVTLDAQNVCQPTTATGGFSLSEISTDDGNESAVERDEDDVDHLEPVLSADSQEEADDAPTLEDSDGEPSLESLQGPEHAQVAQRHRRVGKTAQATALCVGAAAVAVLAFNRRHRWG